MAPGHKFFKDYEQLLENEEEIDSGWYREYVHGTDSWMGINKGLKNDSIVHYMLNSMICGRDVNHKNENPILNDGKWGFNTEFIPPRLPLKQGSDFCKDLMNSNTVGAVYHNIPTFKGTYAGIVDLLWNELDESIYEDEKSFEKWWNSKIQKPAINKLLQVNQV